MAHSKPMFAEDGTGIIGALPRAAVGNDFTIPRQFGEARPELWQRNMHRTGDIPLLALGVVPHVENDALVWGQIGAETEGEAAELLVIRLPPAPQHQIKAAIGDGAKAQVVDAISSFGANLLNINADVAAGAIAAALNAAKLVYLTNVEGLYRDLGDSDSLVSEMKSAELASLLGGLSEGMRPKASSSDSLLTGFSR